MKKTTPRVRIKLELIELTTPGLVSTSRVVAQAIPNNPNVTAAEAAKFPVSSVDMLVNAKALEDTHLARATSPSKTNTALEQTQRDLVIANVTDNGAFVEGIAHAKAAGDAPHAVAILASFGYQTRAEPTTHPRTFEFLAAAKGSFHLRMPGTSGDVAHAHVVQYSVDGQKTWSFPITLLGVDLVLTGLKAGTSVAARYATVLSPPKGTKHTVAAGSEEPTWSDVITTTVT